MLVVRGLFSLKINYRVNELFVGKDFDGRTKRMSAVRRKFGILRHERR